MQEILQVSMEQAGPCVALSTEKSTDGCSVRQRWALQGRHRGLLLRCWYLKDPQLPGSPRTTHKMTAFEFGGQWQGGRLAGGKKQSAFCAAVNDLSRLWLWPWHSAAICRWLRLSFPWRCCEDVRPRSCWAFPCCFITILFL